MAADAGGGGGRRKPQKAPNKPQTRSASARKRPATQTATTRRYNTTSATATGTRSVKGPAPRPKAKPAKAKAAATRKTARSSQAVRDIQGKAYRDFASSLTNLSQTGIRPVGHGGFAQPSALDQINQGVRSAGSAVGGFIRDAFGNLVPQDVLFKNISDTIRDATRRR